MIGQSVYKRLTRIILSLIIYIYIIGIKPVFANDVGQEVFNNTNGLLSSNILDVCETSGGFIWIAQYEGLVRYDGRRFTLYKNKTLDGEDVSLENIQCLAADANGNLYQGTRNNGLVIFGREGGSIVKATAGKTIKDIYVDGNRVYVATNSGAYYYQNGKIVYLDDTKNKEIISITALQDKIYYVDSSSVCYEYDNSSRIINDTDKIKTVRAFDNYIYMGSVYGKLICRSMKGAISEYKTSENQPINEMLKYEDKIYIGTDDGMFILENSQITKLDNDFGESTISGIIVDYEDSMWVATSNGLIRLHKYQTENLFKEYDINPTAVNACMYYRNLLYIGTDTGLTIIDEKNKCVIKDELSEELAGVRIRDFRIFKDKLYIATYSCENYDVIEYDGEAINNITAEDMLNGNRNKNDIFIHSNIRCFAADDDRLVIGTNYGMTIFDGTTYNTIRILPRPLSLAIVDDKIYACTDGGGIKIYDLTGQMVDTVESSSDKTVLKMMKYNKGIIYSAGTDLFYNKDNKERKINIDNETSIVDLKETDDYIIVYTSSSVLFIEKDTLLLDDVKIDKTLDYRNGLLSGITANGRTYIDPENGMCYLNCADGVYKYSPYNETSTENTKLKIAISSIEIDNVHTDITDRLILPSDTERLTISVVALSYTHEDSIKIYYELEGLSNRQYVLDYQQNPTIEYTNLPGGNYTLKIYATGSNGRTSDVVVYNINKNLNFMERPIVRALIGLLIILLIIFITKFMVKIRSRKLQEKADMQKKLTIDSIEAITRMVDAKDKYTVGHSLRVAKYAVCIAQEMKKDKDFIDRLYYIGLMHDIGKIGIPDDILTKPGKLTNEEYNKIKEHPSIGAKILSSIKSIEDLDAGVMYHHERYDGKGYPRGLKGNEIPLIGKIICCADSYDAMSSKRCYRDSLPEDVIIKEFENCSGTQFDPEVAKVVLKCIRNGSFKKIAQEVDEKNNYGIAV